MKKKILKSRVSEKRERGETQNIISERNERKGRAQRKTLEREREGKEKKNDDVRFNNQYSYEYYYYWEHSEEEKKKK